VVLDGTTQPGYAGQPLIVVDGSAAGAGADGLVVTAGNSTVQELTVDGFAGAGIHLEGAGGDLVTGCYVGTDAAGTIAAGNGVGVFIDNSANNTIGGTTADARDLISGNGQAGVMIAGTVNLVEGDYIGTDVSGLVALPNGTGVDILAAGTGNTIGGTSNGAGNLLAGNHQAGVMIAGATNLVEGNYIGADVSTTAALPNGTGVEILAAGTGNIIGGTATGARNVIAGSSGDGLWIDLGASGNLVQGNRVGTDLGGTVAVPNGGNGITVDGGNNTLGGTAAGAGNLISGNALDGLAVSGSGNLIQGNTLGTNPAGTLVLPNGAGLVISGTTNTVGGTTIQARNLISGNRRVGLTVSGAGNVVEGNYVGTDAGGGSALANGTGVAVVSPAAANTIGGMAAGAGNLISGKTFDGLRVDPGATATLVQGNFIGTTAGGTAALPNGGNGLDINGVDTVIGGTAAGHRNLIAGNALAGIALGGTNNQVQGNTIGTNAAQTAAVPNRDGLAISGTNNTVGGTSPPAGNLISGNSRAGLVISGRGNLVEGNQIGTDPAGLTARPNGTGVVVVSPAAANTIGGAAAGAGNLISGNSEDGLLIDLGASGTVVQGNLIGTTANGLAALPNGSNGLTVNGAGTTVGGAAPGAGNVIAGNTLDGLALTGRDALVQGNSIGTNAAHTAAVPNRNGISIIGPDNTIGGAGAGARNVIAANYGDGVDLNAGATGDLLQGNIIVRNGGNGVSIAAGAANNVLWGNAIGTTPAGRRAYPNRVNGLVIAGSDNAIGGTAPGTGNVISGNAFDGIDLTGRGAVFNVVQGNFMGSDATGTRALGNGTNGINLDGGAADNTIGGTDAGAGNVLAGNGGNGVGLADPGTTGNLIQGNSIGTDSSGTLALGNAFNGVYFENNASGNTVGGTVAGAGNTIAFNADDGVAVVSSTGDAIQQNGISSSGNLGIELINGGNSDQAFPTLTSVTSDVSSTTIVGTLRSTPDTTFTLEFFANDVCNRSGYGEGQTFLGAAAVTTDDTGTATFTITLGVGVAAGQFVSATATDPAGNTSQFAACFAVPPTSLPGLMAADTRAIAMVAPMPSQPSPVPPAVEAVQEPLSRVDWYFSTLALDHGAVSGGAKEAAADTGARQAPPGAGRDMLGGPALSLPADGLDAGPLPDLLERFAPEG
jgi:titin